MTTHHVTAFIGVIGAGKDYRANRLCYGGAVVRLDFKDALLDMASDLVGYDVREDYEWFKASVVGVRRPKTLENKVVEWMRGVPEALTGRGLLQRLGTDVMRKRDPDYWTRQWSQRARWILQRRSIAVADCRFDNEVAAIRKLDPEARFIFCNYTKSKRYDPANPHESEKMAQRLLALGAKDGEQLEVGWVAW
jgi:hypothetical protein